MRILAVAQIANLLERLRDDGAQLGWRRADELIVRQRDVGERACNRGVIRRGVRERLAHQVESKCERRSRIQCRDERRVIVGIDHNEHTLEVLGSGAHHRRSADINLLDERIEPGSRVRRRLDEGIQIDDDEVREREAVLLECRQIVRTIASRENAAVKRRVQRLHAAIHHLGKTGDVLHTSDGKTGIGQRPGRTASRHQFVAARRECTTEFNNTCLV